MEVDPLAETVSIYRQQAGALAPTNTLGPDQTLCPLALADLKLRLDDIFSS